MPLPPQPGEKSLLLAGIKALICKSDFDESQINLKEARSLVETLAVRKAETVARQFEDALILGCDSVLALDGEIYGKPESPQVAIARWQKMRGNTGFLYTGHALIDKSNQQKVVDCSVTKVFFADISDRLIEAYIATGEPLNCAGCFAIDGKGGFLVEKIEGCHNNVIGLSLPLLRAMLEKLGYKVEDFWSS